MVVRFLGKEVLGAVFFLHNFIQMRCLETFHLKRDNISENTQLQVVGSLPKLAYTRSLKKKKKNPTGDGVYISANCANACLQAYEIVQFSGPDRGKSRSAKTRPCPHLHQPPGENVKNRCKYMMRLKPINIFQKSANTKKKPPTKI